MMTLVRFMYGFLRKEEAADLDFIRGHPHRNWLIALDALVTISLIFGGVAYASQSANNTTSQQLMRVGSIPMTASQFVKHVHANHSREYWLGPRKGFGISSDERLEGVSILSYVRNGSALNDSVENEITIVTYLKAINTDGGHEFFPGVNALTFVTVSGRIAKYDKTTMKDEIVSIVGSANQVSIHYRDAQSLQTLENDAMALRVA